MKTKIYILSLFVFTLFLSCNAQQSQTAIPKLENYTKGELELKIKSFGDKNPITVGKVMADGTIHLNWLEADISKTNADDYNTRSIENFYGGKFCYDENAVVSNKDATLVETKFIYLYKYGEAVGCIIPSTQKDQEHNKDQLGSTINWIYSDSDTQVTANCSEKKAWEDLYDFNQTIDYDLNLKKGFNLVSNTLTAIETWDTEKEKGSMPKTRSIQSIDKIPANMHWQLKYWANDELLEMEQKLVKLKPIAKPAYENWLPKKLGSLKRTNYEIGKTIKRLPTLNNVNILFEKGSKKMDLTIVDCAGSKDAASLYTRSVGRLSKDWKDKTKTGYSTATKMDENRVMIDYNELEVKTMLNYYANDRFVIKAEASQITPEELWGILKTLELNKLNN